MRFVIHVSEGPYDLDEKIPIVQIGSSRPDAPLAIRYSMIRGPDELAFRTQEQGMNKVEEAVKQNTVNGNDIEIVPGRAYVLTRDVYQTARIDGGPMARVFRQGERFVGADFYGDSGLWPVDSDLSVPEDPDDARDLLATCIMNDEPLPGAVRDDTWARMAGMVVEVPHDRDMLRVAELCRAREEEERREMEKDEEPMTDSDVKTGRETLTLGSAYRLTRDIFEFRETQQGKMRKVKAHRNGDRFVFVEDAPAGFAWLERVGRARSVSPDDPCWKEILVAVVEVPHDLDSALEAADTHRDYKVILSQLVESGALTLEQVVAAAKLYEKRAFSRWDAQSEPAKHGAAIPSSVTGS